jgi:2-polyprenyl-3-methyl-5-hydroxy-6-metoxy-1,4-benzoquinol methylase
MPVDGIYDEAFHKGRLGKVSYTILAEASLQTYSALKGGASPSTVCDVGCSAGALLYRLKEKMPSLTTVGIDHNVPSKDIVFTGTYLDVDFNTYSAGLKESYDLIICQEVIEHIEADNEARVLSLINHLAIPGTVLIFSGAIPGQEGTHHVN